MGMFISGSSSSTSSFGAISVGGGSGLNYNIVDGKLGVGVSSGIEGQIATFAINTAGSDGLVEIRNSNNSGDTSLRFHRSSGVHQNTIGIDNSGQFIISAQHNLRGNKILTVDSYKFEIHRTNISGSSTSTGSFGRVEGTTVSASKYIGQIGSRFVHSQTSDSATWVINHNIGHKYPVVTVYDDSDQMILPQNGVANDSDTFTLTFNEAIQGKAVVSVGGIGENAGANFIHYQSDSSTNWRVTHSLSQQYPNVTVYDDLNQVIIPESITAASSNEMDITFSSGKSGYANFSIGSGIPNISAANAGKVLKVRPGGQGVEWSPTSNDVSGSMLVSGSILPDADNHHDLGSASKRWANLHTGDIQLSNEGTEGNEVDGTTGSWTIQEGEDDLYLLNRKNGKKYKFKLEEIT